MAYIYDLTDTWNAGGTTFNAIKMNVTDTASAVSSKLVTLQNGGTEHFSVTKAGVGYFSGNLGVGTASPSNPLSIYRASGDADIAVGNSTRTNYIGTQGAAYGAMVDGDLKLYASGGNSVVLMADNGAGTIKFATGGNAERMRIDSYGNVGIGTSSPSAKLTVAGNLDFDQSRTITMNGAGQALLTNPADAGIVTLNTGTTAGFVTSIDVNGGGASPANTIKFTTASTERARIDASGNLLVGTTSIGLSNTNSLVLDPGNGYLITNHSGTGSGTAYAFFGYNGTSIGTITQNGTTGVLYNTSSDARLKENIADADDAASLIDAIQVRKFDWKADGEHQRYGFVAQELIEVAPEAVSQPEDPEEMMGVDYSKLVPMLVKEIQSLRARVAQLEGN